MQLMAGAGAVVKQVVAARREDLVIVCQRIVRGSNCMNAKQPRADG